MALKVRRARRKEKSPRRMSITIIKEGNTLHLVESSKPIPEKTPLVLYTSAELGELAKERRAWVDLQMPSFIRGDEDEDASELF